MIYTVVVQGRFASLNQYISALKVRRGKYNKGWQMKKDDMEYLSEFIKSTFNNSKPNVPIRLDYRFYEENKKRDLDNIASYFHKIFQDCLQECGVIDNDNWGYVVGFTDSFYIDRDKPRIEIDIVEIP